MNGITIHKKLVSVFLLNGKVIVKNLPGDPGTIGAMLAKYPKEEYLIFHHTLPISDREFPIQQTSKTLNNE
jgi:hypothetical protein